MGRGDLCAKWPEQAEDRGCVSGVSVLLYRVGSCNYWRKRSVAGYTVKD